MTGMVDFAVSRARATIMTLLAGLIAGVITYANLPKEADPDIPIPFVYIGVPLEGASPEDAERLVVRPLETQLRSLEGVQELNCVAQTGYGICIVEFDVSFDQEQALIDVREKVDDARVEFPAEVDEWTIQEFNASLFPIVVVNLFGNLPERALYALSQELQDELEALPNVLEAEVAGAREELLEVIVDPARLEAYSLTQEELLSAVQSNNRLVTAGALDTGAGRYQVKVPGLFETAEDVLSLPLRAVGARSVTLGDVADVRRTFKDRDGYASFNGAPAFSIQVKKRLGSNIIDTIADVREVTESMRADWPGTVSVEYSLDQSRWIEDSISQLGSSVATAVTLVMILVVAALGVRSGILVGIAIPSSFLLAFLLLGVFGLSMNFMVLFGMVLAVGVLVDGAIVVIEYADRKLAEGLPREQAYALAGKRMFWPIVSSTLTTLAAFVPFLFWDSIPGQYMSFLPKTLIFVLVASLVVALIFLPVLGALVGKTKSAPDPTLAALSGADGNPADAPGMTGAYARIISGLVKRPLMVTLGTVVLVVGVWSWFLNTPHRVEFFLDTEPEQVFVYVRARGNLSPAEKNAMGADVEARVAQIDGIKSIARTSGGGANISSGFGQSSPDDAVATLFIDFYPFGERRDGRAIERDIRAALTNVPGVLIEVAALQNGPPVGKDVQIEISALDPVALNQTAYAIRDHLDAMDEVIEIEDTLPLPGIEWVLEVDREKAGRFQVDITQLGSAVQMVTNGVLVGRYRPDDSDEEVDIRARFAEAGRSLDALESLRVTTIQGAVPISNFVTREARPQVDRINRRDGRRYVEVRANVPEGVAANLVLDDIKAWLEDSGAVAPGVDVRFRGADEENAEAAAFFVGAMAASLFMMAAILLLQFNNIWHVVLTLQAVVLSITGVLLGIQLVFPYVSILMVGTGVVALAGIVVNNNIVLIDTYQRLRSLGWGVDDAIVRTAAQRLRPVLLTTVTTIFGLLPMVFMINADYLGGRITVGGPSAEWWVPLASTVVWGLGFATILTLLLTPVLIGAPMRIGRFIKRWILRRPIDDDADATPARATPIGPLTRPEAAE